MDKRVKILAEKVAKCEKELQAGINVEENRKKIQKIAFETPVDLVLQIDDYIHRKNLLTK